MAVYYKCKVCGENHPSPIAFTNKESFESSTLTNNAFQCPKTGETAVYDKKDMFWMQAWTEGPVEYFSDVFWTHLSPWSSAITFGLRKTTEEERDVPKIRIRMPLQQAKALAVMLLRLIRRYEEEANVTVELPRNVLDSLNIPIEDWERFKGA